MALNGSEVVEARAIRSFIHSYMGMCQVGGEAAALPPDRLSASAKAPARQAAKATASLAEALRARAEGGSHGSSGRGKGQVQRMEQRDRCDLVLVTSAWLPA